MSEAVRLTLLSRTYCHLCEDMAEAVAPLLDIYGLAMDILDVDEYPDLEVRYGAFVPVLLAGDVELSRFHLDIGKVRDYLEKIR